MVAASCLQTVTNFIPVCTASTQKKNQKKQQTLARIIAGLRKKTNYVVTFKPLKTKRKPQSLCSRQCVRMGFKPLLNARPDLIIKQRKTLIYIISKDTDHTSQKTQFFSVRKLIRLVLCRAIRAVTF